ncbi:unnamed protein product (plasmid) [Klebsiella pneumoniae]|nr:unnamed protein product [Klebsiella pneumoniae]
MTLARLREWGRDLQVRYKAVLFCATGQPQLSTLPFCVDRRQRIALAYQWDHRDTGSLLLPEGSRYAKAGGLAG